MAQLHCYVPDEMAERIRRQAARAGMSVSRYLAELARRDAGPAWPEGYAERVFHCPEGGEMTRGSAEPYESRTDME